MTVPIPPAGGPGHPGIYRGRVVEAEDLLRMGRLLVTVPVVLGDAPVWAVPAAPLAGPLAGVRFVPAPGDPVLVGFEGGDPAFPVVLGYFWQPGQEPPTAGGHVVRSRGGNTIEIGDLTPEITIRTATGQTVVLSAGGIELSAGASVLTLTEEGITLSAPTIELVGTEAVSVSAAVVSLAGRDVASVDGGVTAVSAHDTCLVTAPLVEIN